MSQSIEQVIGNDVAATRRDFRKTLKDAGEAAGKVRHTAREVRETVQNVRERFNPMRLTEMYPGLSFAAAMLLGSIVGYYERPTVDLLRPTARTFMITAIASLAVELWH
jgi:predicted transcriptional regulator